MFVYKFGGASIATAEDAKNIAQIILNAPRPLIVVVSAIGKTTNALEQIINTAKNESIEAAQEQIRVLESQHYDYAASLINGRSLEKLKEQLALQFTSIEWALDDIGTQSEDYVYDQVVSNGELLSTLIIASYLESSSIATQWIDARDVIRTNEHYRNAQVDEESTQALVHQHISPALKADKVVVTQGFIGASSDNNSTTLGREGSDYTAALLGAMVNAQSVTIWKDVPGFLNADPRIFKNTTRIPEISFHEVIELTYYGAQIIHPKTIKPIRNKAIPLYVKCFKNTSLDGTVIHNVEDPINYPPLIVLKQNQVLLQLKTRDFSFISEENLSRIYDIFSKYRVKMNMIQNAAISFTTCIDANHFALQPLLEALDKDYLLTKHEHCNILTVRHYNTDLKSLIKEKEIIMEQKTGITYQALYK